MAATFVYEYGRPDHLETLAPIINAYLFGLFTNDVALDVDTVFADLTLATFTGSTPVACTFGTISRDANDRAIRQGDPITWTWTGGAAETCYGFVVLDGSGTKLYFAQRFAAPRTMAASGDEISIIPRVLLGDLAPP